MDQGQLTGAVFIDLRKAFDTVDHAVLLDKLSNLGILDKEHGWFTDYLSNRTQVVEFQGVTSASEAVSTGVPQGSILGPLLFILHINDLPEVVSDCNILMYADDTVLYCSSSQASVIQDKLNAELSKIDHWLSFNSLFVNVTKTEAMLFGTAPRLSAVNSFSITLNNNVIKRVFHFTYLGIVFDDRLSWNEQIKYLISKAGKRVGMLGRLRRSLTRESANVVYCSLIRPILEYCVSISIVITYKLKPSFIHVNSSRFFADLRPFKPTALVVLMYFSEIVICNKVVIIIITTNLYLKIQSNK